jgi:hypothetical protein
MNHNVEFVDNATFSTARLFHIDCLTGNLSGQRTYAFNVPVYSRDFGGNFHKAIPTFPDMQLKCNEILGEDVFNPR